MTLLDSKWQERPIAPTDGVKVQTTVCPDSVLCYLKELVPVIRCTRSRINVGSGVRSVPLCLLGRTYGRMCVSSE